MATQPLTHHAILSLVEPFTRSGRQLDLAASDRIERRLLFKPVGHGKNDNGRSALIETLELYNPETGLYRLTRIATLDQMHVSRLVVDGADPGRLLAQISVVDMKQGFKIGPGYVITESYRLEPLSEKLILTHASAKISDLSLTFEAPTVRGYPAEFEIKGSALEQFDLPEDILAILGRPWSLLDRNQNGWRGRIKLRGREPQLSKRAAERLEMTVQHLAVTLSSSPDRFHAKFMHQRWSVFARRCVPIMASVALIAGAASLSQIKFSPGSAWQMLLFNAPPLLMIAAFGMRDLPRIEIPPFPRPLTFATWRKPTSNL